jgi:hypothetical protein
MRKPCKTNKLQPEVRQAAKLARLAQSCERETCPSQWINTTRALEITKTIMGSRSSEYIQSISLDASHLSQPSSEEIDDYIPGMAFHRRDRQALRHILRLMRGGEPPDDDRLASLDIDKQEDTTMHLRPRRVRRPKVTRRNEGLHRLYKELKFTVPFDQLFDDESWSLADDRTSPGEEDGDGSNEEDNGNG